VHHAAATTCPCCGTDWDLELTTHWGLDVHVQAGRGDCYVVFMPCCEDQQAAVERWGYDEAYGRRLMDVVAEITGRDVLSVLPDGDGAVVCRLAVVNPTQVAAQADELGRRKATSPRGWQSEVFNLVDQHHRHHDAPQGWKAGVAVHNGAVRVGVAVLSRPVSRVLQAQHPRMLEVTRVCTWGHPALRYNASSKLYAECAATAKAMGYDRLVTYTLHGQESGASLVAAGWVPTGLTDTREGGHNWRCAARPHASDSAPTGTKVRWERGLSKAARRAVDRRRVALPSADQAQLQAAPAGRYAGCDAAA